MKNIIINADDFGLKPSVNLAIIELFKNNLINSTTLMANMPSFEDAVEFAHNNHITDKIGIHLHLDEGYLLIPKTKTIAAQKKVNRSILKIERKNLFFLSTHEKNSIYKEFSSQIERVKRSGINITHIDTHHHMHEIFPVTLIVLSLLKEYRIPTMRILNNLNSSSKLYKRIYRRSVNKYIELKRANLSDYFGNQLQAISKLEIDKSLIKYKKLEIMVHPEYNNNGIIVDIFNNHEYSFDFLDKLAKFVSI
jgi:hypothetical protein